MKDIIEIALKKVDKSLDSYPPYDIDETIAGGSFIVEFSTYYFTIQLLKAEIYNDDGELNIPLSEEFAERVEKEIAIRNRTYKESLEEMERYPHHWDM